MCGIAGIYLRDPEFSVNLNGMLDTLLEEIEDRGRHATGYVAVGNDETLEWQKAACKATEFIKHRRSIPEGTRAVLGHTRWATQGLPAFMENNHPIKRGPFFIIHNGHVNNDSDLFKTAERDRYGEVDSEAIAARLSSYGDLKYLGNVMEEIEGAAAVAALDERNGGMLALARGHSSPLWVYKGSRIVVFASTMAAVEKAYEKHIGRMSKTGANYIEEGTMLFWRGDTEYWTKELMLPKSLYSYGYTTSYSGRDSGTQSALGTGSTTKSNPATSYYGDWSDYDIVECDSCSIDVIWKDSFYFYDPDDKYTWMLCEDCYEKHAFERSAKDAGDADWSDIDDDDFDGYDDYEASNASILQMIKNHLKRSQI